MIQRRKERMCEAGLCEHEIRVGMTQNQGYPGQGSCLHLEHLAMFLGDILTFIPKHSSMPCTKRRAVANVFKDPLSLPRNAVG
eukprot:635212-Pelagomonas_calceolata.AAC.2